MPRSSFWKHCCTWSLVLAQGLAGCASAPTAADLVDVGMATVPRELDMASLPIYRVAPPDILLIEAVNNIRTPDSPLRPGDTLLIQLKNGLPIDPTVDPQVNPQQYEAELQLELQFKLIRGPYVIGSDGTVDLGPAYRNSRGTGVLVAGLTVPQAYDAIRAHLQQEVGLTDPELSVSLPDIAGRQPISGEHLVRPDGTVSMGIYGDVHVAGQTLADVKNSVERHLSQFVQAPEVRVDVVVYNSKSYYIITDGGGLGEQVVKVPSTGNETVLDAISQINGLPDISSKKIWIARPAPAGTGQAQILKVNWEEIATLGVTDTNFQVLPGDRIYIRADKLSAMDNAIGKITAPLERIAGFTLLGVSVGRSVNNFNRNNNNGGNNF